MQPIAIILISLGSLVSGVLILLGYILKRMMSNDGWDDSNVTNALRLLSHVALHPEDFGSMYYLSTEQKQFLGNSDNPVIRSLKRPFHYVSKDELSEVVKTRPA